MNESARRWIVVAVCAVAVSTGFAVSRDDRSGLARDRGGSVVSERSSREARQGERDLRGRLEGWGLSAEFVERFLASAALRSAELSSTRKIFDRLQIPRTEQRALFDAVERYRSSGEPTAPATTGMTAVTIGGARLPITIDGLAEAFLSDDPFRDCNPYLTGVQVFSGADDSRQLSVRTGYGASAFPTNGADFLLMSTGDPDVPAEGGDVDFGTVGCADDNVQIVFTFAFPDLGDGLSPVNSMKFDFDLFSYEFPEFVGAGYNDYVFAYLDAPVPVAVDEACNAPIGFDGDGCLVTFDGQENPTNIDNVFFQSCSQVGCDAGGVPGWESTYDLVPGDDSGRTGTLITCTPTSCTIPVTPGIHTLTLMVGDAGDGIYTTAGLFDNLRCFADLECEVPTTEPVYLPPLCERILDEGSTPNVAQGLATTQEDGAYFVAIDPVVLQNAEFDTDFFEEGEAIGPDVVNFTVTVIDPLADGQGIVVVTDSNGSTCTLEVDFNGLPAGPTNETICSTEGALVQVSNPDAPGGVASCTATEQGAGEPSLPTGWVGSPEGDPAPCKVYTVDSSVVNTTEVVLKKDGVCDPNLRLLFSRSSDGGATFPPFVDVTQDLQCITDIIPDPTRVSGVTLWSPVKITCGILVLDCTDPLLDGLDQDGDGVPFCHAGAIADCNDANPAIPVRYEGKKLCNGLDDDCDGVIDEGCTGDDEDSDDDSDEGGDNDEDEGGDDGGYSH